MGELWRKSANKYEEVGYGGCARHPAMEGRETGELRKLAWEESKTAN